jgi:hypothetical protein
MTIHTVNSRRFELKSKEDLMVGFLEYQNNSFGKGEIVLIDKYTIELMAIGVWDTYFESNEPNKKISIIKVEAGGTMSIRKNYMMKKYLFKKSVNWKLRFSLFNGMGDELLTLIPTVNWKKESYDFNLQLNEEFEYECDAFLILQALHCANCSLSMMQGGSVPALISI